MDALVRAYRVRGHMMAKIDPLGLPRPSQPELDPEYYGLSGGDLDRKFSSRTIFGARVLTLREILTRLRNTYCRSIGVQFMHIDDLRVRNWLQDRMEARRTASSSRAPSSSASSPSSPTPSIFEEFIHKKFVGAKSFSLEGARA